MVSKRKGSALAIAGRPALRATEECVAEMDSMGGGYFVLIQGNHGFTQIYLVESCLLRDLVLWLG